MSSHDKENNQTRQTNDLPIEEKDFSSSKIPSFRISDDDVSSLLFKMVNLGYFHKQQNEVMDNPVIVQNRDDGRGDGGGRANETNSSSSRIEEMKECKDRLVQERQKYKPSDAACCLLFPTSTSTATTTVSSPNKSSYYCMTRRHLTIKIEHSLLESNGRLSLETVSHDLGISISDVERSARDFIMERSCHGNLPLTASSLSTTDKNVQLVQNELFTSKYFDDICRNQVNNALLESNEGCVLISDLARDVFRLPFEYSLAVLLDRIVPTTAGDSDTECCTGSTNGRIFLKGVELIVGSCGGKQLVTADYQEKRRKEVLDLLSLVTIPTLVCM